MNRGFIFGSFFFLLMSIVSFFIGRSSYKQYKERDVEEIIRWDTLWGALIFAFFGFIIAIVMFVKAFTG